MYSTLSGRGSDGPPYRASSLLYSTISLSLSFILFEHAKRASYEQRLTLERKERSKRRTGKRMREEGRLIVNCYVLAYSLNISVEQEREETGTSQN